MPERGRRQDSLYAFRPAAGNPRPGVSGGTTAAPLAQVAELLEGFRSRPVTPAATYDLEQALLQRTGELSRQRVEEQLNLLEPADAREDGLTEVRV